MAGLALGSLVAFSAIARAEDKPETKPAQPPVGAPGQRTGVQNYREKIATELKLTDDQKQKWEAIFKEQAEKAKAVHADTALSGPDRMAKVKEMRDSTDAKIKALLTPEQQEKWKAMREKMREGGGRGQPGASKKSESKSEQK